MNDRPDIAVLVRRGRCARRANRSGRCRSAGDRDAPDAPQQSCWVGVSTHTLEQVDIAERTSADYVAFGPVFPTATKEQPDPVVGLALLTEARARTTKPLVAIGGITLERAAETYRAGADSLAVARDLIAAENPGQRARAFLNEAKRALCAGSR